MPVLVDSNVLLDLITEDPRWFAWSSAALERAADNNGVFINPIVYAEISVRFSRIEDLEEALPRSAIAREPIPYEAAFLAGKTFSPIVAQVEHGQLRCPTFSSARMRPLREHISRRAMSDAIGAIFRP